MTMEELSNVQGRAWEDVDVSASDFSGCEPSLTFHSIDAFTDGCHTERLLGAMYCTLLLSSHVVQYSDRILLQDSHRLSQYLILTANCKTIKLVLATLVYQRCNVAGERDPS
jgi:hypothetical protein